MSEHQSAPGGQEQRVVIIGPNGQPMAAAPASTFDLAQATGAPGAAGTPGPPGSGPGHGSQTPNERSLTELVEQPAKVMRIGTMIRQLLEEVKAAPLDEASRNRLKDIHRASITELEDGLAPELVEELDRLTLPFTEGTIPTEGELRIAQAQLVGWLEGLFHGIQTAMYAQQMAARAQLEQVRRGLPPGSLVQQPGGSVPGPGQPGAAEPPRPGDSGGMYL